MLKLMHFRKSRSTQINYRTFFYSLKKLKSCRDQLKRNCSLGKHHLEISVDDLKGFSESLSNKLHQYPARFLTAVCFCYGLLNLIAYSNY